MVDKHSFHIKLADGSERDVKGDDFKINDGVLSIFNDRNKPVVVYNAGVWSMIETEARDDRGYPSAPAAQPRA